MVLLMGCHEFQIKEEFCDCFRVFTIGGCKFCSRVHHQWSRFQEDVNDVVPLAVSVLLRYSGKNMHMLQGYTHKQLSKAHNDDSFERANVKPRASLGRVILTFHRSFYREPPICMIVVQFTKWLEFFPVYHYKALS